MRLKLTFLFVLLLLIFSLLLVRLFDVTLIKGSAFYTRAESNRYFTRRDPAERAIFLDRYGQALVQNQKQYLRYLQKDQLYSTKEFIEREEALALLATDSASVGHEFLRVYPRGEALSSALGYLAPVTAEDLAMNQTLPLSSRLGRLGLEQFFDTSLRGKAGSSKFEANALGQKQRLVEQVPPALGQNIQTSLDPLLSEIAYQALAGRKGAVVIMDASNGELLSLVSSPSFDPNVFEAQFLDSLRQIKDQVTRSQISDYLNDERQVFFNRASAGAYPPGSVFKLVTALAALQEGAVAADTTVDDQGTLKVGDFSYANWYFTQYGRTEGLVNVKRALARSNDIFFYKAAEWLGPTKLANYARLFGFGSPSGVQLPRESAGLVPDPEWKERVVGENWYLGNTYHFGIGQGDLTVTPLQVAGMTQALANFGRLCSASLLRTEQHQCRDLALKQENLELVLDGMLAACSTGGTAYPLFPHNAALVESIDQNLPASEKIKAGMVACKTGTAEFGSADERGYRKTHAWLTAVVGLEPELLSENFAAKVADLPRQLVITVLIESGEEKIYSEGSEDAAPVVREVLEEVFGL
jgi:penicillin-binding protein 2